ncbi:SIR6 deacetylase, partial [Chloropsis hardwickii]|nr:SIR6 deacetylase [Chloropsis hardwickii]
MAVNYAAGLSPYSDKGKCGLPEVSAAPPGEPPPARGSLRPPAAPPARPGLPRAPARSHGNRGLGPAPGRTEPFVGPNGVWTMEEKGLSPKFDTTFENARPSKTHMALLGLQRVGILKFLVSQNVDGLHVRSGFPRDKLAELHGNMFVEECVKCGKYVSPGGSWAGISRAGISRAGISMPGGSWAGISIPGGELGWDFHPRGKPRGQLMSHWACHPGDIPLSLGEAICPLSRVPAVQDRQADLRIHGYVDEVMTKLMKHLGLEVPEWTGPVVVESAELAKGEQLQGRLKEEPLAQHNGTGAPCAGNGLKQECPSPDTGPTPVKKMKVEPLLT